jgi:peptidyl-prolyl cis-trans isomerase SurA
MLRKLRRACDFPRICTRTPFLWTATVLLSGGCASFDTWHFGPSNEASPAVKPEVFHSQPLPPPEINIPSVSRSQKPESAPAGRSAGSLLDQVSYTLPALSNGEVAARIRATVNGEPILDEEVRDAIYPFLILSREWPEPERSQKRAEIFRQQLQHLIEREVVLQDMFGKLKERPQILDKLKEAAGKEFDKKMRENRKRLKINSEDEFKAYLHAQGMTIESIRRQIEREFMAMEYMRNRLIPMLDRAVTLEQIVEYYQKHPEEFSAQDSVVWHDIFIDAGKYPNRDAALQAAQAVVAKARQGENFLQLVAQFDNGDSSYRHGEGTGHRRGEIKPPEAEPYLFKMTDGEIGPIVEQANGYHVIRLVKREFAGIKPLDEKIQKAIRSKMEGEVWEREYKRMLAELKRNASIEISTGTP